MSGTHHQQVMELFHGALDLHGAARDEYLQAACGDDQPLLDEVTSLLHHHDPRTILPEPVQRRAGPLVRAARGSAPSAGERITRWFVRVRAASPTGFAATILALLLAFLLAALGAWLEHGVQRRLRANLAGQLEATLHSNVAAVRNWLLLQQRNIEKMAADSQVEAAFRDLLHHASQHGHSLKELRRSAPHKTLHAHLSKMLADRTDVLAANGATKAGAVIFDSANERQGEMTITTEGRKLITPVFLGKTIILPPTPDKSLVRGESSEFEGVPVIVTGTPIRADQEVIGGLFLSIESGKEFTDVFDLGRAGERGDTFAFSRDARLLSASRYEDHLRAIGWLDESENSTSVLNVQLRDPGTAQRPGSSHGQQSPEWPLTEMTRSARTGTGGMNLDGYRDYRGMWVVGAWNWLAEYDFGVATEIEYDQAYAALRYVRWSLASVTSLSVILSLLAFGTTWYAFDLRRQPGESLQLGSYTLTELIGEGGMGKVYLARHALLRRPTAVKMLDGQCADQSAIARFEREVQLTSSLTHPNTVEIYDYGRTRDGIFYFAMEYLPGLNLGQLVGQEGALPVPRVLHIVRQILASLAEAHGMGLMHRDIKPANVILSRRGGLADFVKVVDFGLARPISLDRDSRITQSGMVSGTPLYIAPECLRDASQLSTRSDIYSLGSVAFYLVTGRELFAGATVIDILNQSLNSEPPRPSEFVPEPLPAELDELIVHCVASDPQKRPQSVQEVQQTVDQLVDEYPWSQADAEQWWRAYEGQQTL